jgi:hypothetical protein
MLVGGIFDKITGIFFGSFRIPALFLPNFGQDWGNILFEY